MNAKEMAAELAKDLGLSTVDAAELRVFATRHATLDAHALDTAIREYVLASRSAPDTRLLGAQLVALNWLHMEAIGAAMPPEDRAVYEQSQTEWGYRGANGSGVGGRADRSWPGGEP